MKSQKDFAVSTLAQILNPPGSVSIDDATVPILHSESNNNRIVVEAVISSNCQSFGNARATSMSTSAADSVLILLQRIIAHSQDLLLRIFKRHCVRIKSPVNRKLTRLKMKRVKLPNQKAITV